MDVRGIDDSGVEQFAVPLRHGADPSVVVYDQGWVVERPIDARRQPDGELVLRFDVRPIGSEPRPTQRPAGREVGLALTRGEEPVVRQRVAAYGVVVSDRGLLATQYSDRTAVEGRWGMPGGGIDEHEEPVAAVAREVYEETAQTVQARTLLSVQTSHWVGRSPTRRAEDFHAVRLVYEASCPDPGEPVVLDVGGTTAAARWVPLPDWRSLTWTVNWRDALERLLPR
ncbi:MAG TPA: NUDIX domain-containing protein [Microlunatus sp.]|nr:NUDIX domain-containing protein [Microlunatus sp.]